MFETIRDFIAGSMGLDGRSIPVELTLLAIIALAAVACYYLTLYVLKVIAHIVEKSPTTWDDDLLTTKILKAVSQLTPAVIVAVLMPRVFGPESDTFMWIHVLTRFYVLWASVRIVVIFIGNLYEALSHREKYRAYAVQGIFQMLKLISICIGAIIAVSILINRSPVAILTALGASAAVLMLVFRDTILGLVASVQLSSNKMLKKGDWIVADKSGANGEVIDVSLTTVKVRNWDNSVTTIPPYSLVSESFKNFQPMKESGGRRVSRSVFIDVNTVRFLDSEEIEALQARGWLDGLKPGEAGKVVNLQLLRRYLERFLETNSNVNTSMTFMVRQMEPTPAGLPLELYFFLKDTEWKSFEHLQSDIFDHVYAVIREFGLAIYQAPAGTDIAVLKK